MKLVLYDSLSQSLKEIPVMTQDQKALAWYTCGPTTYSAMHLGHARTYVWFDMMRRVLEFVCAARGAPPPLFVMNITDIDDKIIASAAEEKVSPMVISRRAEASFWRDMEKLGCQRPHITTRVTELVDSDIVPYIERLVQQDMAYVAKDGVYFDVLAFEQKMKSLSKYGKLAGAATSATTSEGISAMEPEASDKRDRRDFALWKLRKEGEDVYWSSPWGDGRPGWHIECSAMIQAVQKRFQHSHKFLVHGGGIDLKFPHHTNEIAQAEAYHYGTCNCPNDHSHLSKEWIQLWIHTGHLMVKQTKMSKSLKNFLTTEELWFDYDAAKASKLDSPADDFRLWCLMGGSYGHREEYSRTKIKGARKNREKILRFLLDGERWLAGCKNESTTSDQLEDYDKRWSAEDYALFISVNDASKDAYRALLNNMRGTAYVDGLIRIAEAGSAHIRKSKPSSSAIAEPVKTALQTTRNLLSLLGFSDLTVRAGLLDDSSNLDTSANSNSSAGYVAGGESALIEEVARFRAAVRKAALHDVERKRGTESTKAILEACDKLRDAMPGMGIELMDGKDGSALWRFCVPKEPK
jgi:cysteinyl-tRNA synthetase